MKTEKTNRQEKTPMERWHRLKERVLREVDEIHNATESPGPLWIGEMLAIADILEIGDAHERNESR